MPILSSIFRKKPEAEPTTDDTQHGVLSEQSHWEKVLVPAVGRPYSMRGLEVACRLARTSNATVNLVYIIEVPRSLVINASLPDAESLAAIALRDAEEAARQYKVRVLGSVHRTRNAKEGLLKMIYDEGYDLLVLGARPDEIRGLPKELTSALYEAAPCEVVLDYIAGEQ